MTIARLTAIIEAVTGNVPTQQQVLRVGNRLYMLTTSPDPEATNQQKAVAVVLLLRQHLRGLHRSGAEAIEFANQLTTEQILAAAAAADVDL